VENKEDGRAGSRRRVACSHDLARSLVPF